MAKTKKKKKKKGGAGATATRKRRRPAAPPADDEEALPKFAVAFIDSEGQEHLATASAPDPGVALAGLLEKAAELDQPWLDDLVAVVVSHPTTWATVREGVLEQFEPGAGA